MYCANGPIFNLSNVAGGSIHIRAKKIDGAVEITVANNGDPIPPGRVPVETLTRFSLQVNLDTAEKLKLVPPLPMFNYAEIVTSDPGK
jgi:hypothetical protein